MTQSQHLETFYQLLSRLSEKLDGKWLLSQSHGRMNWAKRGVYFFFEAGETRQGSKDLRVVRVGTHAVSENSRTTLWNRLYTHKGTGSGGGNHRGSIFRLHLGQALIERDGYREFTHWGKGSTAIKAIREAERAHEKRVSAYIGNMPILWVEVSDDPSKDSDRGFIERNAIVLLADANGQSPIDVPSENWLGNYSPQEKIRRSGLWNLNYVGTPDRQEHYNPAFLEVFERYVEAHTLR